jgi:quercetin dioxygenase-like cupin family protein
MTSLKSLGWPSLPILLSTALLFAACGDDDSDAADGLDASDFDDVTRQVLGGSTSDTAPDQLVELTRVVIPAGDHIPAHTHPGPQLAVIVSGTLTYTVIEGEAELTRDAGTDDAESETIESGESVELEAGDTLIEPAGMAHQAENETDDPVVIHTSSLFPEGEPPSSPVE